MPNDISAKEFFKEHAYFLILNPNIYFSESNSNILPCDGEIMSWVSRIHASDLVLLNNLLSSEDASVYEEERSANKTPSLAEVQTNPTKLHPNVKQKLKSIVYSASVQKTFDIDRLAHQINFLGTLQKAGEALIDCSLETKNKFAHKLNTKPRNSNKQDNFSDLFDLTKTKDYSSFDFNTVRFKHHEKRTHRLDLLSIEEINILLDKLTAAAKSQMHHAVKPAAPKISLFLPNSKANRYASQQDESFREYDSNDTLTLL